MSFDPQKIFIGLMDFFSILLPDALLTYLLMGEVGSALLWDRYAALDGTNAWAAFLFASYLFGHLVFLLGYWLDEFYDWARDYTLRTVKAIPLYTLVGLRPPDKNPESRPVFTTPMPWTS